VISPNIPHIPETIGKPQENGDLMRVYGGLMGFNGIYPLVN
jgi:hypothetical protein